MGTHSRPHNPHPPTTMFPTGKFVMESSSNLGPFMVACGAPEAMTKAVLNPANESTITICENEDGSFTSKVSFSLCPEMDHCNTMKIGETIRLEKPIPCEVTSFKKGDNCFASRSKLDNGDVIESVMTFHNYGLSVSGCLEGKNISYKEEFKKVCPSETGYFVFESETGMADLLKAAYPNIDLALWEAVKNDYSFRVTEKNGVYCMTENRAGNKKCYSMKMDEEFEYCDPAWKVDETRVMTRVSPGVLQLVCKSKKDGRIMTATINISEYGITEVVESGGLSCTIKLRRMPDIEGTWKAVATSGMQGYFEALGVDKSMASEFEADGKVPRTVERLCTRKMKVTGKSKFFPEVMVLTLGEEACLEIPSMGTMKMIYTENKDEILSVMKLGGHTISSKEKISGDFGVQEVCVDGCPMSTMKVVQVRQ